ncbi:MAG: hypothetical protein EWV48_19380 [Microcystis aeruginosa Ma_QC_C_20070823_S13]|nr:MAG: hypothetical protein EWV84_22455 [Microcystis sp. M_QC_C_20170808_M3Col]TRU57001.1 MAG: hypothetical protein EWV48_19380 [Microcystis aeruginosa Ma_QC_C_20070823_S13]TRU65407.1 MAG: hypothetical protein EWV56_00960 [Microcystis aeruginosa Ma_QC_C_20070823_S13D]
MRNFAPIIPICRPKNTASGQRESFYRIRVTRGSVAKSKEILKIPLSQGEADRDRIVKSFFLES